MSIDIKECPNCGTVNTATAPRCDCGFDLSIYSPAELSQAAGEMHSGHFRLYLTGTILATAGFFALLKIGLLSKYLMVIPIFCAFMAIRSYYAAKWSQRQG